VRLQIDGGASIKRVVFDLYSNLVTRPTGAALRREIESVLAGLSPPRLTVIDFSQVGLLDFSCADEVVGKLVDGTARAPDPLETYVLVRGVREDHLEAIESSMARYDQAVLVQDCSGQWQAVGSLEAELRRLLEVLLARGRARPLELAADVAASPEKLQGALEALRRRRLVLREGSAYVALPWRL
jgi:hypothetical protein